MGQKEEAKPRAFTVMLEIYYLRATSIIFSLFGLVVSAGFSAIPQLIISHRTLLNQPKKPPTEQPEDEDVEILGEIPQLIYTAEFHRFLVQYPIALHSWHPAASCSIRKLCIKSIPIYMVPNWMGSLGNLGVLKLSLICVRSEDVEILGEIPSLLFLNLVTFGGTTGRIIFPGNNGFRSLKFFSLYIRYCGTSLEFEVGSMPKLEHVNLQFLVHKMECLNGASSLGIQHLSSLNKVEIKIGTDWLGYDRNYNPAEDNRDDSVRCISRAINAAIETLPNRPTARFQLNNGVGGCCCEHFESDLRKWNQDSGGLFDVWLKLWQIREEQAQEATDSETEQEDDSHENEDEEQTNEDEETSEKEVAQQDDSGSNN